MAVRIALQCSEADAHLILSEDNTAARLLTRPGEAIYNDANGLVEGQPPVPGRLALRRAARRLPAAGCGAGRAARHPASARRSCSKATSPPIRATNVQLREAARIAAGRKPSLAPRAWLGAAVAIKDPTRAVFRRQSGSNLLIVGQQEELALGMLANSVIALARRSAGRRSPRFIILDGTPPDSPEAGFWPRAAAANCRSDATVVSPREAGARGAAMAAEVERRLAGGEQPARADLPGDPQPGPLPRPEEVGRLRHVVRRRSGARAPTSNWRRSSAKGRPWASTRWSGAIRTTMSTAGSTGRRSATSTCGCCSR